jgi:hypothetical protein
MLIQNFYLKINSCGGIGNGIGNSHKPSKLSVMPEPEHISPAIDYELISYLV